MPKKYDIFVSHASEDKSTLVQELAEQLSVRGYRVWYDEFSLSVGHGLRRSIDHGISQSRYGIVVLSKHFFAKEWPNYELDGIVQLNLDNPGILLPLWHEVSKNDVSGYSPSLANIVAISTNGRSAAQIITQLERTIGEFKYSVGQDQSISRSPKKVAADPRQREAGFQVLLSIQEDQLLDRIASNSRSEVTIYPYSMEYCQHPFHFWQNEPGIIRLVRHVVYDIELESIISTRHEILQNDGCHLISRVTFQRQSAGPIRIVCDLTTTNQFTGLFEGGFEFVEFNNKSRIEHFSYTFTMPRLPDFEQIKVYANDAEVPRQFLPGVVSATQIERPIIANSKLKFSFINEGVFPATLAVSEPSPTRS